jgi:hypothetical protein
MLHGGEGQRCQAKRSIRAHQGLISAATRGTIQGKIENLGRHLIAVQWDTGEHMYVFPDEINIEDEAGASDCDYTPGLS